MKNGNTLAPMLNLYPDSIGGTLKNIAAFYWNPKNCGIPLAAFMFCPVFIIRIWTEAFQLLTIISMNCLPLPRI